MKKVEVRISGLGGQGVVLAGQILGKAAIFSGKNAVQTQSYGAEARGSTAKSEVIISTDKIGFPMVRKCDILVVMSQEALERNVRDLKENGILLVDSSTLENVPKVDAHIYTVPATKIAQEKFGQRLYANLIMLGALIKIASIVDRKSIEKAIKETVPEKVLALNLQALEAGIESVK